MLRYAIALSICLGILTGCTSGEPNTTTKEPETKTTTALNVKVGDFQLNNPVNAGNVTLVPITYNKPTPQQDGNFITLGEAKKAGVVEITEREGGDVNSLTVTNKGDRPILLLGGELLLGGKQDRIVARDVVVPAGKTMSVEVFCVEHDRWEGESQHFEYKDAVVPDKVRQAAAYDGQEAVWGEVAEYNTKGGHARGGTIAAGLSSETVTKALNSHLPKVLDSLKKEKNVVGVIYVLNGQIQSADLFGSPKIFESARESLVRGYLADGANEKAETTFDVQMNTCRKFLEEILKDRDTRAKAQANGTVMEMDARNLKGLELSAPASAGRAGGYVHGNYAPKKR